MSFFRQLFFKNFHRFLYLKRLNGVRSQWFVHNQLKKFIEWRNVEPTFNSVFNPSVRENQTIWVYWKQGLDSAPEIVKKCISSIKKQNDKYDIVVLDEKNLHNYVSLPDYIEHLHNKESIGEAAYSDLLRLQLCILYGGVWCDATCFFTKPIPDCIENADFFMFSRPLLQEYCSPIEGSNWFIKAKKNNSLLKMVRNFLFEYYKKYDFLMNYFLFHIVMGLLIHNDKDCSRIWENKPYLCNMNPHVLQFSFTQEYTKERLDNCLSSCFVHKLTYKYTQPCEGSILFSFLKM